MATIEETTCPECGGQMVSRKNAATGARFWGCAKYPRCKGTRNVDGEVPTRANSQRRPTSDDDPDEADDVDGPPSERARGNDRRRWERD